MPAPICSNIHRINEVTNNRQQLVVEGFSFYAVAEISTTEQSALELASAYMQVQRYADAYNAFASVLMKYKYTPNTQDIKANMEFCKKPLPWSQKLRNHDMGYWHNFMLYRFGGRRKVMLSQDVYIATDNFIQYGHL